MRRFLIILFGAFVLLLVLATVVWSNRQALLDFVSDAERMAAAPLPQSFEETVEPLPLTPPPEWEGIIEEDEALSETPSPIEGSDLSDFSIPSEFNLAVPFTPQAPHANWDATHEETCEEAAIYMVHEFYQGRPLGLIDADTAEADIMQIVEFEKALFGFFESTTAVQTAVLVEQMYGYERVEVIENPTVEDLKAHIIAGRPVVVPAAGRLLGNPNFRGEGPLYHALVLKGYTETTFVTNDPGTRRGSDYQYDFDTVMNSMHDWNGGDVVKGEKVVIIIYPN